jgi:hypothetical protein
MFRIRFFSIPDPHFFHPRSRIRIKEFKYGFLPQKLFLSSRKYYLDCSWRIRIPDPDHEFFTHPGSRGSKRHRIPEPGSGSVPLVPARSGPKGLACFGSVAFTYTQLQYMRILILIIAVDGHFFIVRYRYLPQNCNF